MAPLEVINAGFSRTGTLSLYTALNILGYNTIHFKSFNHDESLDLEGFKAAIDNREEADWDKLYENYNAAVDIPTWLWYKDLVRKYPDAKVILTVRDPESWYISIKKAAAILEDPKNHSEYQRGKDVVALRRSFIRNPKNILYGNFNSKESAIAAFERHTQEVIDFVPKENLLVMHIGEGWEKLCKFLEKPIPDVPFPNMNTPKELEAAVSRRKKMLDEKIESLHVGENE